MKLKKKKERISFQSKKLFWTLKEKKKRKKKRKKKSIAYRKNQKIMNMGVIGTRKVRKVKKDLRNSMRSLVSSKIPTST